MQLEKQVVSLELAKKLKELGVKQESCFYWLRGHIWYEKNIPKTESQQFSAFTVAELGEMLPVVVKVKNKNYFITPTHPDSTIKEYWYGGYNSFDKTEELFYTHGNNTEADARAKCLIYLIENNLIKDSKK